MPVMHFFEVAVIHLISYHDIVLNSFENTHVAVRSIDSKQENEHAPWLDKLLTVCHVS